MSLEQQNNKEQWRIRRQEKMEEERADQLKNMWQTLISVRILKHNNSYLQKYDLK